MNGFKRVVLLAGKQEIAAPVRHITAHTKIIIQKLTAKAQCNIIGTNHIVIIVLTFVMVAVPILPNHKVVKAEVAEAVAKAVLAVKLHLAVKAVLVLAIKSQLLMAKLVLLTKVRLVKAGPVVRVVKEVVKTLEAVELVEKAVTVVTEVLQVHQEKVETAVV